MAGGNGGGGGRHRGRSRRPFLLLPKPHAFQGGFAPIQSLCPGRVMQRPRPAHCHQHTVVVGWRQNNGGAAAVCLESARDGKWVRAAVFPLCAHREGKVKFPLLPPPKPEPKRRVAYVEMLTPLLCKHFEQQTTPMISPCACEGAVFSRVMGDQ